jgi:hypothetical protein
LLVPFDFAQGTAISLMERSRSERSLNLYIPISNFTTLGAYKIKNTQKNIIFQSSIAPTFRASVIAPKIQELIPLVFPLKIKGKCRGYSFALI